MDANRERASSPEEHVPFNAAAASPRDDSYILRQDVDRLAVAASSQVALKARWS